MTIDKRIAFFMIGTSFFLGIGAVLWTVFVFLTPAPRVQPASYDELMTDLHDGFVDEVRIDGEEVTYRTRAFSSTHMQKQAKGPKLDVRGVRAMLTAGPKDAPPPKIYFER